MRNDRDIALKAIKLDGNYLRYTNIKLRSDPSIVYKAVIKEPDVMKWASTNLKKNKNFIKSIVKHLGSAVIFHQLRKEYNSRRKENQDFLNEIFAIAPDIINIINMELSTKQVIKAIYSGYFSSLPYKFRNNLNFAKIAIKINQNNVSYLGDSISSHAEFRDIEYDYDDIPF